uniref:EH domain-containing protein n=1 Tax=Poecilia mexicana TaxID=48701 RepID=A0A3B3Y3A0_9TELE
MSNAQNASNQAVLDCRNAPLSLNVRAQLVDPENTGKVGPTEAALFLKKSGLPDSTLGKIWDLADPEGKGYLDKQGFYVALRLVACAQSGQEVSVSSINQTVPPPQFTHEPIEPVVFLSAL